MKRLPGRGSAQRDGCIAASGAATRVNVAQTISAIGLIMLWAVLVMAVVLWFWRRR